MSDVTTSEGDRGVAGRGGWRRYAAPLLLGSLALNLLFIGATVGGHFAHRRGGLAHQPIERGIVGFVRSLPNDRAQALMQPLEGRRPQFKESRKALREARGAAFDAFTSETIDVDKLRTALQRAGEAEDRMQALGTQLFVDLAQRMTPDERKGYRTWREPQDKHYRGKRHDKE